MSNLRESHELKLAVHVANESKRAFKAYLAILLPMLKQYIGKKILTVNGDVAKLFVIERPIVNLIPLDNGFATLQTFYFTEYYGKLAVKISLCFNGKVTKDRNYTQYVERTIELGILKDKQVLESVLNFDDIVNSYGFDDAIEFEQTVKDLEEYNKKADELQDMRHKLRYVPNHLINGG